MVSIGTMEQNEKLLPGGLPNITIGQRFHGRRISEKFHLCYNYFMLKQTPIHKNHLELKAKMAPFAGWDMPISYKSIIEEHNAVRNAVGIFDIGHMGLIKVEGNEALALIQKVVTNDASKLAVGQCQYSIICNEAGGVIDDVLIYRQPMTYLIVANASNTEKVLAWLKKQAKTFKGVSVSLYDNYCMISIQGPAALKTVEQVLNVDLSSLKHNHTMWWRDITLSRTGYTGEDGIELIAAKKEAAKIWDKFIKVGVQPCGLGARDTLRLEAGYPLYGHEYDDKTTPLEAGYAWAVKFDKGDFIGKAPMQKEKDGGLKKKLVGLSIDGRQIARAGDSIVDNGKLNIGVVTSGTFSPTLKKPIALAYLATEQAAPDNIVNITIRGKAVPAQVVAKSFYKR